MRSLSAVKAKRALLVLAVLALAVLAWLVLRHRDSAPQRDDTWQRIQQQRVLRVGMDASYPPFEVVDDQGRFSGYDVDLATALAERWGVQVQFVVVHFDGLYDALLTGKCDLIVSALPYDRTQTRDLRFSQSYFDAGLVLLARADDQLLNSANDLAGRKVAVELGSEAHQWLRALPQARGIQAEAVARREPPEVYQALREGATEAIVCDRVTAFGYIAQGVAEGSPLRMVGPSLTDAPYVIAARPEAFELLQQVNAALEEWRLNGMLEELGNRWF